MYQTFFWWGTTGKFSTIFGDTSLARLIIQLVSKTEPIVAKAHNYIWGWGTTHRKNKKFKKAGGGHCTLHIRTRGQ